MTPKTGSVRVGSHPAPLPARSTDEALDQAMLRAYTIERALDYGCAPEDVLQLRRRVEAGQGWADAAEQLADDNEQRAAFERAAGHTVSATGFLLQAAACLRLAQAGLEHDVPRRLATYERQARNFRSAVVDGSARPRAESLEVLHHAKPHQAWLFRAPAFEQGGATVLVWGGLDGWCEAFHASVPFYLERGLSVCLLELPGQGLARLRHGSLLATDFPRMVSSTLDALVTRGAGEHRFGVVGHSAGGSFAVAAAGADERIRACCSNGGSGEFSDAMDKYPRVLQRFGRALGTTEAGEVRAFFDGMDLARAAGTMRANLLCLQGGQDPLVTDAEARRLVQRRGEEAATLEYWPDGVHCIYNHAIERNCVITDWFERQLAGSRG